jgi:hypothetical protein
MEKQAWKWPRTIVGATLAVAQPALMVAQSASMVAQLELVVAQLELVVAQLAFGFAYIALCSGVFHSVAEYVTIVGANIGNKGAVDCVYMEKGRDWLRADEKYANRSFG